AVQLRDLLADVPLGPSGHIGPCLPDRVWVGLERRLAFEQVHACPCPPGILSRILPAGVQPGPIYRHHAAPTVGPNELTLTLTLPVQARDCSAAWRRQLLKRP